VAANIDDMNPELFPGLFDKIIAAGALDVSLTPLIMKKGRPANQLNVMCGRENFDGICRTIFQNSTTIGIRINKCDRLVLNREKKTIIVDGVEINFKISYFNDEILNVKPEYDDVKKYSELKNISLISAQTKLTQEFLDVKF